MTKQTRDARENGLPAGVTEEVVNDTIDEAISCIRAGQYRVAIEAIEELAHWYKSAGERAETFAELCRYIENEAVEGSDEPAATRIAFGRALAEHRARKNGTVIVGMTH